MPLTLDIAETISNAVIAHAKRSKYAPIAVVVTDANSLPVVSKRMDGCAAVGIPQFAQAKATTCAVMKMSSRKFRDRYVAGSEPSKYMQMQAMVSLTHSVGGMAPFPGGVLLKTSDGAVYGAIGVSGAAGDEDELCALAGATEAVGLVAGLVSDPDLPRKS